MIWPQYLQDAGTALQKGLECGLHTLEGAVALYGTYKGAMELAGAIGGGLRAAAPAAVALL